MQTKLFNNEAEQCLLGCILMGSKELEPLEDIFSNLDINDFYVEENRKIFATMKMLFNRGKDIDFVTISEVVGDDIRIEYLTNLCNIVPSIYSYPTYLKILKNYSKLRDLQQITLDIQNSINSKATANEVQATLEKKVNDLSESEIVGKVEHISVAANAYKERIRKTINGEYTQFGMPTGYPVLDKTLWGLQPSDLVILGARAGVGKTAFALNIINSASILKNKVGLFFSLEMPNSQIVNRLISIHTGIDNYALRSGKNINFKTIEQTVNKINESKFYIEDTSNLTVADMIIKSKQIKRKYGLDYIVIDYLQFIKPSNKNANRFQAVGEIARDLKVLARTLNVPVIALCQLNRALDNEDRQPTLADLRESGEIENNADLIMFLHSDKKTKCDDVRPMELIIGKHRNGALKAIRFNYKGATFKFTELEKQESKKEKTTQVALEPIDEDELPF